MDQRCLALFLPTEASWLGPGGNRHFLNRSDYCFIPLQSLPSFYPPHPSPPSNPVRPWRELHLTSSCSRAKCPSTTLNSPGYLKPLSPASLILVNTINVWLPLFPLSFIYIIIQNPLTLQISLHYCLLPLIAGPSSLRGLFFFLISLHPSQKQDSSNTWTMQQSCTM